MSLYAEFNHNISLHHEAVDPSATSSSTRHIMLLNEDLPEVMMEKMEIKKRGSPKYDKTFISMSFKKTNSGLVDKSLFSSIGLENTHRQSYFDGITLNLRNHNLIFFSGIYFFHGY